MSFISQIIGEGSAGVAKGVLEGVGGLATSIRSAITGELPPAAQERLRTLAIEADTLVQTGQHKINLAEAKHTSIFVAGWRPFIGWICGLALAWNFLLYPMIVWHMTIKMPLAKLPPALNLSELMPIVLGILGLGVYRTVEKVKKVQREH